MKFTTLIFSVLLVAVRAQAPEEIVSLSTSNEDFLSSELAEPRNLRAPLERSTVGPDLYVEKAFYDQFPISVAVSKKGRKFVSFPHWEQNKGRSLVEINSRRQEVLYPSASMNNVKSSFAFTNVHAIFIDEIDRLWVLDTGLVTNNIRPVSQTRFFVYDLNTNCLVRIYTFGKDVQKQGSQLQDIRFDKDLKYGMITDASNPGIAVLNLKTGKSFRRLDNHTSTVAVDNFGLTIEGRLIKPGNKPAKVHSNGVAISKDKKTLYYAPVSSRSLYSVPVDALIDQSVSEEELRKLVKVEIDDKGSATSGLITGDDGSIYLCNLEHNSITKFDPTTKELSLVVRHTSLLWPDTLAIYNNRLYITANQMHRRASFNNGTDIRKAPYYLFSIPI